MKLDRNLSADGRGKYGLVLNRKLADIQARYDSGQGDAGDLRVLQAAMLLESVGLIDWGTSPQTEFFVIRLKDEHAGAALAAYASDAKAHGDQEYASHVYYGLAVRAGRNHPHCKKPD